MAIKYARRPCPACGKVKSFPLRNKFCSRECSADNQRGDPPAETSEIEGNTWEISLPRTRIHTLDELLTYCEVDTSIWEVERFVVNKWEIGRKAKTVDLAFSDGVMDGYVRDSGVIFVEPLFQVKAYLRRKVEILSVREELAAMRAEFERKVPRFKPIKRSQRKAGNVLELTIPDLHMNKLAWSRETGHGDYNVEIAEQTFEAALAALIERTSSFRFDEVLFVVGNDLLHTDNAAGTTTAGTPVTGDTRYYRAFWVARQMLTRAIERLREIAPVRVIVVPGNHDALAAWHLGDSLACYFHKCRDVTVDNEPVKYKYYRIGSVMLMWTHGDEGKRLDYPLLMATERPEMFGVTKWREAHTGDKHHVRLEEQHGVRVRTLPSLCQPDDWHSRKALVGSILSAEAYVWNKEDGLIGTATYSVA